MGRGAAFSRQVIAHVALGSMDARLAELIMKVVHLDLIACMMMIEYADSLDITDAKLALLVYFEGHFFAKWVDGTDDVSVY